MKPKMNFNPVNVFDNLGCSISLNECLTACECDRT
jgi:hypothetical protein